jgi:hypothetical protein
LTPRACARLGVDPSLRDFDASLRDSAASDFSDFSGSVRDTSLPFSLASGPFMPFEPSKLLGPSASYVLADPIAFVRSGRLGFGAFEGFSGLEGVSLTPLMMAGLFDL